MNLRMALACLVSAVFLCSCGSREKGGTPISGPPQAGATYSLNDGEGGFRLAKVLVVNEEIVFVNLYSDRWTARPLLEEARKAKTPASLAYSPASFTGMQPVHLESGQVTDDELEEFDAWNKSKRDVF
jgi:hypothetical protein